MAIDYSTVTARGEVLKNEETFFVSAFADSYKYKEIQALAMRLQDLILTEKGTYPSALTMGVGIRNYLFEFMDDPTIETLTSIITEQQQKFLPSDLIKGFEFLRNSRDSSDRNKLYLFVHLNKLNDSSNDYFVIGLAGNPNNGSIIKSDIYL